VPGIGDSCMLASMLFLIVNTLTKIDSRLGFSIYIDSIVDVFIWMKDSVAKLQACRIMALSYANLLILLL